MYRVVKKFRNPHSIWHFSFSTLNLIGHSPAKDFHGLSQISDPWFIVRIWREQNFV